MHASEGLHDIRCTLESSSHSYFKEKISGFIFNTLFNSGFSRFGNRLLKATETVNLCIPLSNKRFSAVFASTTSLPVIHLS